MCQHSLKKLFCCNSKWHHLQAGVAIGSLSLLKPIILYDSLIRFGGKLMSVAKQDEGLNHPHLAFQATFEEEEKISHSERLVLVKLFLVTGKYILLS